MNSKILSYKQLELANALERAREQRVYSVVDARVKNMLPQWLQFSPDVFWLQRPEDQKNLEVFSEAIDFFLKQGIQRGHRILGIGGGATTDFAGFMAATIHRGVSWTAIPTTLMGMVDAAIGGKTALNTKHGKNLLGAFHAPDEIWICSDFLKTLTSQDLASGKGEIVKYGLLDQGIHDAVMEMKILTEDLILQCARYKLDLVSRDFKDQGERAYLNLGHTLGHAFEHNLKISHGLAVAMGLKYILKAFDQKDMFEEFSKLVRKLDIDEDKIDITHYKARFDKDAFWQALGHDKKRSTTGINIILVDKIGSPRIEPVSLPQLRSRLEALSDFKG
ncbi:MAG: 3-dehydroquinate synthase family protein [Bacteriovoracia bacterium]